MPIRFTSLAVLWVEQAHGTCSPIIRICLLLPCLLQGNPTGLNAEAVSQVPIYTVMGTADKIMKISNVEVFLTEMDECKAEYKFDIEDGWTHEDVCKKSYTNERLAWVFKHVKGQPTGIVPITKDDSKLVNTAWYSINGQRLTSEPTQKGIYIKCSLYSNGKVITDKYYKN